MKKEIFTPNWVAVEKKLPEYSGNYYITYYDEEDDAYYCDESHFYRWGNITDWYDCDGNTYGSEPLSECHIVAWAEMPKVTPYNPSRK